MKANSRIENADAIPVTLTMTAPLGEWRALRKLLPTPWPAWELEQAIGKLIENADRVVEIELMKEGDQ